MLLIQNGRVLDPYTNTDEKRDVLIGDDGVIARVEPHIDPPAGCETYDAAGLTVSPGFLPSRMVCAPVCGMIETAKLVSSTAATVRLTPSMAIEPFSTMYRSREAGVRTVTQTALSSRFWDETVPVPSM